MVIKMTTKQYHQHIMVQTDDGAKHDTLYQAHQRIQQLEKFNAKLAAQIDRQAKVVDAALHWYNGKSGWSVRLSEAVCTYKQAMAQLAKDGS
jgi:hypothetical protein